MKQGIGHNKGPAFSSLWRQVCLFQENMKALGSMKKYKNLEKSWQIKACLMQLFDRWQCISPHDWFWCGLYSQWALGLKPIHTPNYQSHPFPFTVEDFDLSDYGGKPLYRLNASVWQDINLNAKPNPQKRNSFFYHNFQCAEFLEHGIFLDVVFRTWELLLSRYSPQGGWEDQLLS